MEVAPLCATLCDPMDCVIPWTVAYHGCIPPSMEFSRREYCSGLPFPSPGDLPNQGIEPRSRTQVSLTAGRWQPYMLDSKRDTGMIWENSIETCMLPSVKQITSLSSMHETGHLKPVHWDNPMGMGWGGRWEGGSGWGTRAPMADSCECMAKPTTIL